MNLSKMCFITILSDISLEEEIRAKMVHWGALNCYLTESKSILTRNQSAAMTERKQMRLESICDGDLADTILTHLQEEYGSETSITYYISDVLTNAPGHSNARLATELRSSQEDRWGDYLITI